MARGRHKRFKGHKKKKEKKQKRKTDRWVHEHSKYREGSTDSIFSYDMFPLIRSSIMISTFSDIASKTHPVVADVGAAGGHIIKKLEQHIKKYIQLKKFISIVKQ